MVARLVAASSSTVAANPSMQLDGGRTFAAGLAARLRSTFYRVSLRCAVALYSIALLVALAALWCMSHCARIFELY